MAYKAKPVKKKPFMTIGVPNARRSLGSGTTGGGSAVFQPNLGTTLATKSPVAKKAAAKSPAATPATAAPAPSKSPGSAPAGRPQTNIGKYLVKPTDNTVTGYEMLNEKPDLLETVNKKFIEKFELPTHLRPTRFLSPELEHGRSLNISRGWRKPRGRAG